MTECIPDLCILFINHSIGEILLIDGQSERARIDPDALIKFGSCAVEKFRSIAGDVPEEFRAQLVKSFNTSTAATQEIFYIAFGSIAITILLVTLIIFAALYWRHEPYVIPLTFILALLIIIAAGLIAYFWITSVYNNARNVINTNVNNINQVLNLIQTALLPSACCFGGKNCGKGAPCTCLPN